MRDADVIGFAGLSHLGIVSGIAAAAKGERVIAYDPDSALCAALDRRDPPVFEPGLPELLEHHGERIQFTPDPAILRGCDVIFFSLDVPTDASNRSNLAPLDRLIETVSSVAAPGTTLVVLSQVPPGFTRARGLHHCQVETLIFGRAVERALRPERIIVGCHDPAAPLPAAYTDYLHRFDCPVLMMRYESAELTKIAINMFLVSSVSTTNTLAELCEAIGAEWSEIAPALRLDKRIGVHAYLTPGLGLSGGNLERDLATVKSLAVTHGTDATVVDAWVANSTRRREWALRWLRRDGMLTSDSVVAIWGLAYKPDTASTKNSPTLSLLEALAGVRVSVYDPAAPLPPGRFPRVHTAPAALAASQGADALVIMTPWREFSEIDFSEVAASMRGRTLVDPYGVIPAERAERLGFVHYRLGSGARGAVTR